MDMEKKGVDSMNLEPSLKLAFSIHVNPGVYALLLGSGVSRAGGIKTGWDIVVDLIEKIARLKGEEPTPDPVNWYIKKFGEEPNYSKLLEMIKNTPTERMRLLHDYFEPTDEEREVGKKMPTKAHKYIAQLVKDGFIKIILTTNFDRLLEMALENAGVMPEIVSSVDDLDGIRPYYQLKCLIVKLHGDYLDTRIRNTDEELKNYPDKLNSILDRIFDEYGLIVCGWSAEYDKALRKALLRCSSHRYSTYWTKRGTLKDKAEKVIRRRDAEIIQIESADQFFFNLVEKIESLRELNREHPLSIVTSVETVKRYIADPKKQIQLHEMLSQEVESVFSQLFSNEFETHDQIINEVYQERLDQYEVIIEKLVKMLVVVSYYGKAQHISILTRCLGRLSKVRFSDGDERLVKLQYYPTLFILYAVGITSLARNKNKMLAEILCNPQLFNRSENKRINFLHKVNICEVFHGTDSNHFFKLPHGRSVYDKPAEYLYTHLIPILKSYIPDEDEFSLLYERFDYLISLTYIHLHSSRMYCLPIGRVRRIIQDIRIRFEDSHLMEFIDAALAQGEDWELITSGLFEDIGTFRRLNRFLLKEILNKREYEEIRERFVDVAIV